jgi:hypothetical protein
MEGGVWVPRTVPYLKARGIAKEAIQEYGDRLVYQGKVDAALLGFVRECWCDEVCELKATEDDSDIPEPEEGYDVCTVPAWYFTIEEPR